MGLVFSRLHVTDLMVKVWAILTCSEIVICTGKT